MANDFFTNPWTQVGAGILSATRPGVGAAEAIGSGMLTGLKSQRRNQEIANRMRYQDMIERQQETNIAENLRKRQMQEAALAAQRGLVSSRGMPGVESMGPPTPGGAMEQQQLPLNPSQQFFANEAAPFMQTLQGPLDPAAFFQMMGTPRARQAETQKSYFDMQKFIMDQQSKMAQAQRPVGMTKYGVYDPSSGQVVGAGSGPQQLEFGERWGVRKDIAKYNQAFADVSAAAQNVLDFIDNPGPIQDYGAAVKLAKLFDPTSVAREAEVAAVQEAGPLYQRLLSQLRGLKGSKFGSKSRNSVRRTVNLLLNAYRDSYQRRRRSDAAELGNIQDAQKLLGEEVVFPVAEIPETQLSAQEKLKEAEDALKSRNLLPGRNVDIGGSGAF